MTDLTESIDLCVQLLEKIKFGECLIEKTKNDYSHLEGIQKLQRKIKQELTFLRKVYKTNTVKKEHLQCSNLTHFSALVDTLTVVSKNCISINKVFLLKNRKITVDIVCDNGLSWIKVVARNPKSLDQICRGEGGYGVRSVLDQAEEFVECAKQYPSLFQTPKIVFVFANGVTKNLLNKLESLGIKVEGTLITGANENQSLIQNNNDISLKQISNIKKINLDVSALLAYVSSVTNGGAEQYEFNVKVLAQQAEWEKQRPQKPMLDEFFKGKQLYCCQTAYDNFINIVNTVGGPNERIRANEFLKRIIVLPDDSKAEDNENLELFQNVQYTSDKILPLSSKIKERSLTVFTFGDRIRAVTVTANDGFVRAARQQGINFVVFVHESRALTEQKEQLKGVKASQ